jgi:hypothetical protein
VLSRLRSVGGGRHDATRYDPRLVLEVIDQEKRDRKEFAAILEQADSVLPVYRKAG